MIPRSLKKRISRWLRAPAARSSPGLHTTEQFRSILDRERARSDRNGDVFSLLTFAAIKPDVEHSWLKPLVRILRKRLRSTDEVGWLDDERIGVVLTDAEESGAWRVADDVLSEYPTEGPMLRCEVYSYPHRRLPTGRENLVEQGGAAVSPSAPIDGGESLPARQHGDRRRSALNMERLFARPLPLWKRSLDIAGASVGLVFSLPLMAAVALAVKATSPGPAIFRQRRGGLGGGEFTMYKFRTMFPDAESRKAELLSRNEQDGPAFKIADDPRVTRLGRWLRRTSIDELPQLWNVLRGDMSLVGPRPLPSAESNACDLWHRRRLDVTPGLTCIWQVRGRSSVSFTEWMRMDLSYVRARSLTLDLRILLATVPAVVLRRGAR